MESIQSWEEVSQSDSIEPIPSLSPSFSSCLHGDQTLYSQPDIQSSQEFESTFDEHSLLKTGNTIISSDAKTVEKKKKKRKKKKAFVCFTKKLAQNPFAEISELPNVQYPRFPTFSQKDSIAQRLRKIQKYICEFEYNYLSEWYARLFRLSVFLFLL